VNADKDKITQVLCNLLANAIKFTTDGTISITTTKRIAQNDVVVSIKDNGVGINPTIIPLLFSKFISTSPDGLGLGLFITKNIISAHGGRIWAQNNPNEKGATFSFLLPLY
jgi:signal transduction histidine kinase